MRFLSKLFKEKLPKCEPEPAVDRGDGNPDAILQEISSAWERCERLSYVTPAEGIMNISSTQIRERLRNRTGGLEELLHPRVMGIMKTCGEWENTH